MYIHALVLYLFSIFLFFQVRAPRVIELQADKTELYIRAVRENINPSLQLVVAIFPTQRDDRYSSLKKLCCVECPVPSQVKHRVSSPS